MASFTSVGSPGSLHHPIFSKFQPEHVTQFLDHAHKHDQADSRFRRGSRWFRLTYVLIGIGCFVFLTFFLLPSHADLYFEILKGIGVFSAGIAGGYGINTFQNRRRE